MAGTNRGDSNRNRLARTSALVLGSLLATGLTWAAQGEGVGGPTVRVRSISEESITGSLVSLDLESTLTLRSQEGVDRTIPVDQLILIKVASPTTTPIGGDHTVLLVNGDTLYGAIRSLEGESDAFVCDTDDWGIIRIPWDAVRGLILFPYGTEGHRRSMGWIERYDGSSDDRVLLTNGDELLGFVTGLTSAGLSFESTSGVSTVELSRLRAARLGGPDARPSRGLRVVLTGTRRAHATCTSLRLTEQSVRARLALGGVLETSASSIASLHFSGGGWDWLSRQQPISHEHTPMLGLPWDYHIDRNVLNGPLQVGGMPFAYGIGVHSRARLRFDLRGEFREFITSYGLDDNSGPLAGVDAAILVDGKVRHEHTDVRPGTLHGPVRIDVRNAQQIELVVDFGINGDVQDRFDWIEPGLTR